MDEFLLREFEFLLREQRKEFVSIMEFESDLDLAYRLQMEEAMVASLALQPSSSSQTQSPPLEKVVVEEEAVRSISNVKTLELDRLQTELKDREECEAEMKRVTEEMKRRVDDQKFASEILAVPEREWRNYGEYFENPFGEGSSSSTFESDQVFKLYFKGLIVEEKVEGGLDRMIAAIGVAICDPKDNVLLRIQKPLIGDWKNHRAVDLKALIEGLNAAIALNIRRVHYFCVNRTNYLQIAGRWKPKQRNIIALLDQVFQLESKFETCETSLVAGNDLKYAFKLAKDAIDSQFTKSLDSSDAKNLNETCSICLEDTDVSKMFAIDGCLHRYCFSCMKQHMEVKLLHGMVPACPHEGCDTKLSFDTCKKFLPPKLVEMMGQLKKEASIPVTEKIYCPYPKCSILMSKAEALEYANNVFLAADRSGVRKCIKCHGLFCINCKVPWHSNMNCHEYKRSNLSSRAEEAKLKSLANQKLWRQCVKCNHMIELAEGCYHMTCRCGYEFCYTCGAEWKNKKQTCSCKLWDEDNILYDDDGEDEDEEDDYFDDEYEEDYESDDLEETRWRYFFAEVPMA